MNINLSLFGQMLTFIVFIWFTMKYVWPPLTQALLERQKKISDGLEAAEHGQRELELAGRKSVEMINEAKAQASHIIEEANKRGVVMIEQAKQSARDEGARIVSQAQDQISQEVNRAKEELRKQVGSLAIGVAEKLIHANLDESKHLELINAAQKEL